MKKVRCAIYTRKSSEEGLEQGFNSLDAQREACAAYVLSQASEGWHLLPDYYDDGGISGGTLERPALQRLLGDVAAGRIDIIVLYKVDRLTRSLLDFAKLVEAFDKTGVSFVSITQSFNTTTSMGRLTLNMLLSFAQFEREVTAERIRDKIAASKAKGMWMGGTPPLGYRPAGRSLAIVDEHAERVRDIFQRYLDLGNVRLVAEQIAAEGITTPRRTSSTGRDFGGCAFSRGQIYKILANPIYIGAISHRQQLHAGQHEAIIDPETWERAQSMLAGHVKGERIARHPHASLFAGLIVDAQDQPLVATHACKGKVRYRYYVSRALQHGTPDSSVNGLRIPAREIEQIVIQELAAAFDDPIALAARIGATLDVHNMATLRERSSAAAQRLRGHDRGSARDYLARVQVLGDCLELTLAHDHIAVVLGVASAGSDALTLTVPVRLTRTGRVIRLIQGNGASAVPSETNSALIRLVARAHRWWSILAKGDIDITTLAKQEDVTASYVIRVVRSAFLAPSVIDAIVDGTIRAEVDAAVLRATDAIPTLWDEQCDKFLPR